MGRCAQPGAEGYPDESGLRIAFNLTLLATAATLWFILIGEAIEVAC